MQLEPQELLLDAAGPLQVGLQQRVAEVDLVPMLKPAVDNSLFEQDIFDIGVGAAQGIGRLKRVLQRDEAIRSGSLAVMTLILTTKGQGLVSTPMIGLARAVVNDDAGYSAQALFDHATNDWRDVFMMKINMPTAMSTGRYSDWLQSQSWFFRLEPPTFP